MTRKPIIITEFDLERLRQLVQDAQFGAYRNSPYLQELRMEIEGARVVTPQEIPADVITMNSTVVLADLESGEEETYTLVFPEDADLDACKVSILAPIGTGMLGYGVGDVIDWEVPAGTRRLRVERIVYQPESRGDCDEIGAQARYACSL